MPKGRYKIMTALHAEGRHARPRHDVPDLHGAGQPRLLLRSRHGAEDAGVAGAAAGRDRAVRQLAVHRRQAERLRCRSAPRSGATPTTRAPACCRSCSSPAWASSAMSTTRSTCRCISSSAATATSTCRDSRSAISWPASCHAPASAPRCRTGPNHLSTIFPEVRLKRYLEMRGADGGPWRRLPSLPAFWVGLLYDDDNLDACWDIVKDWTAEERQKLRDDVPKLGLQGAIRGRSLLELARETLRAGAKRGPGPAQRLDHNGRDETRYSAAAAGDRGARHHAGRGDAGACTTANGTVRSSRIFTTNTRSLE